MQPQNFGQRHLIDVRIDLGSPATRGRTIIDNRTEFNLPGVDKWTARATYFEIINKDALYASIRESINTLVENSKGN
jgi:inosine-uridine nucleoside N-ribohydrolase